MKIFKSKFVSIIIVAIIAISAFNGCNKIKAVKEITEQIQGNRLYFCERYVTKEINEGSRFKAGKITVMLKLKNAIGETAVDINLTNEATGKVVETYPFTCQSSWDYIHFDNVEFKDPGKYKVSCLKKDGTVIVTGEVEII